MLIVVDKQGILQYANNEIDTEWMLYILDELTANNQGILKDINTYGTVNILDAVILGNFVLGFQMSTELECSISDLNSDGILNVLKIIQLTNIIFYGPIKL